MKLIIKSRIRDVKKNLLTILLMLLSLMLPIISLYFLDYYGNMINEYASINEESRLLSIYYYDEYDEELIKKIESIENVLYVYEDYSNWQVKTIDEEYGVLNYKYRDINIIDGRSIENNFEVIVSKDIVEKHNLDVNKSIEINDYDFTICGVTDSHSSILFINPESIRILATENYGIVSDINILVSEYNVMDEVILKIKELGYEAEKNEVMNTKMTKMEELVKSVSFGVYVVGIISVFILFLSIKMLLENDKKNNALFKLFGFTIIKVILINFIWYVFMLGITSLLILLMYFILYLIMNILNVYMVSINMFVYYLLLICLLAILIIIISFIYVTLKTRKIDILEQLES